MASFLFVGCIRSCTRQQGTASNLLSRCCFPAYQQCAQAVSGQAELHTISGSGQTCAFPSNSPSCLSSGGVLIKSLECSHRFTCFHMCEKLFAGSAGVHGVASSQFVNLRHFRTTSGSMISLFLHLWFHIRLELQPQIWVSTCLHTWISRQACNHAAMQYHMPNGTSMTSWVCPRQLLTVTLRKHTTSLQNSIIQTRTRFAACPNQAFALLTLTCCDVCATALGSKAHITQGDEKAQKQFQEVSEAYDTLKDSSKRSMYDRVGPEGMENMGGFDGGQGGFGGAQGFGFGVRFGSAALQSHNTRSFVLISRSHAAVCNVVPQLPTTLLHNLLHVFLEYPHTRCIAA